MRISKPPHERRAELVKAARQLFDERGVEKTRVSDIVGRVGVAQGVFYYYFESKEAMVRQVVQDISQEMKASTGAILADTEAGFCKKLAGFIALYLHLADQFLGDDETSLAPLFGGEGGRLPAMQSARVLTTGLRTLVEQAAQSGELAVAYPWETAQTLLFGLARLAERRLPSKRLICSITEQALALPEGELYRQLQQAEPMFA